MPGYGNYLKPQGKAMFEKPTGGFGHVAVGGKGSTGVFDPAGGPALGGGTGTLWNQGGGATRPPAAATGPISPYAPNASNAPNANMYGNPTTTNSNMNAAFMGRYSVGPYGALVAPNQKANPTNALNGGGLNGGMSGNAGGSSSEFSASYSSGVGGGADYQSKYNEAKAANEARYAEGKGEYSSLRDRNMSTLDSKSGQELTDIEQRGQNRQADVKQRMQSLGLSGTTIGGSLATGVDREVSAEKRRAMDANAEQRIGVDTASTRDLAGFIERRSDPYPDPSVYAQLAAEGGSTSSGGGVNGASGGVDGSINQGGYRVYMGGGKYGPIIPGATKNNPAPTGVNLEYLTGAALNDPEYMERYGKTAMTSPPKLLTQKQAYRY